MDAETFLISKQDQRSDFFEVSIGRKKAGCQVVKNRPGWAFKPPALPQAMALNCKKVEPDPGIPF